MYIKHETILTNINRNILRKDVNISDLWWHQNETKFHEALTHCTDEAKQVYDLQHLETNPVGFIHTFVSELMLLKQGFFLYGTGLGMISMNVITSHNYMRVYVSSMLSSWCRIR